MSDTTAAAHTFVAARLRDATRLGERLADLVTEPSAFQAQLATGLAALADPAYAAAQERVAPGSGAVLGVRWPLLHEVDSMAMAAASTRERVGASPDAVVGRESFTVIGPGPVAREAVAPAGSSLRSRDRS